MEYKTVKDIEGTPLAEQIKSGTVNKMESVICFSNGEEKRRSLVIRPYKYWKFFVRGLHNRTKTARARNGDMGLVTRLFVEDKDGNTYIIYT